jgi:hypothetical protein
MRRLSTTITNHASLFIQLTHPIPPKPKAETIPH